MEYDVEQLVYLRDSRNQPFGALAFGKKDGKVYVAGSICQPEDQFSKRKAHLKTFGRLRSNNPRTKVIRVDEGDQFTVTKRYPASILIQWLDLDQGLGNLQDKILSKTANFLVETSDKTEERVCNVLDFMFKWEPKEGDKDV